MRKNLFCFLGAIIFVSMSMNAQDSKDSQQSTELIESTIITIEGMACQEGCADAISANLKKVSGVRSAIVSFSSGQADIEFNPNEVSIDSLKSVITHTKVKDYVYTISEVMLLEDN